MTHVGLVLITALPFLLLGSLFIYVLARGYLDRRLDFRTILADGTHVPGSVRSIGSPSRSGACRIEIEFEPAESGRTIRFRQATTVAAIAAARLAHGSAVAVQFLPKSPKCAFAPDLVLAGLDTPWRQSRAQPAAYFVSFTPPGQSPSTTPSRTNSYKWTGQGFALFTDTGLRLTGTRARLFRSRITEERQCALDAITNVELFENALSFVITEPGGSATSVKFWTVNAQQAADIAARLPATRTGAFAPVMAEADGFVSRLKQLTPSTPVTVALIGVNTAVFLLAALLGAGVITPNPEVIVRIGSDYTPLTMGGQWWRLLTSAFLHFGLIHLAFNMWALWVNGPLAERIFGSSRYLVIYLVAGITGSIVSLWWHMVVNGAGASGAIFGVFGALLAFFLRAKGSVPASVISRYRNSVAVFIAYNLLNGARVAGIDNAAHLGGLVGGFALGVLLMRPLDGERKPSADETRWSIAIAIVAVVALLLSFWQSPSTSDLLARQPSPASQPSTPVRAPVRPTFPTDTAAEMASCTSHCRTQFGADATSCLFDCDTHKGLSTVAIAEPPAIPDTAPWESPAATSQFWGVRLGMSRAEVERAKGLPIKVEKRMAIYAAGGVSDQAFMEIVYGTEPQRSTESVRGIFYRGDLKHAPPGLPFIDGISGEQLTDRFGTPVWSGVPDNDSEYQMFADGLTAVLWHRTVKRYGIQNTYQTQP